MAHPSQLERLGADTDDSGSMHLIFAAEHA
jgi:hypothetical protein